MVSRQSSHSMTSCPPADRCSICGLYFWRFRRDSLHVTPHASSTIRYNIEVFRVMHRLCAVLQMSAKLFVIELVHFTISCSNSTWATGLFIIWLDYSSLGCSVLWKKTKPSIIWPCHSLTSYSILQLILKSALYVLIYLTSLYFWWWRPPILNSCAYIATTKFFWKTNGKQITARLAASHPTTCENWVDINGISIQEEKQHTTSWEEVLCSEEKPDMKVIRLRDPNQFVAGGVHRNPEAWDRILVQTSHQPDIAPNTIGLSVTPLTTVPQTTIEADDKLHAKFSFLPDFPIKKLLKFVLSRRPVEILWVIESLLQVTFWTKKMLIWPQLPFVSSTVVMMYRTPRCCYFQYDICSAPLVTVSEMNFINSMRYWNAFFLSVLDTEWLNLLLTYSSYSVWIVVCAFALLLESSTATATATAWLFSYASGSLRPVIDLEPIFKSPVIALEPSILKTIVCFHINIPFVSSVC